MSSASSTTLSNHDAALARGRVHLQDRETEQEQQRLLGQGLGQAASQQLQAATSLHQGARQDAQALQIEGERTKNGFAKLETIRISQTDQEAQIQAMDHYGIHATCGRVQEWAARKFRSCVCYSCVVLGSALTGAGIAGAASDSTPEVVVGAAGGAALSLLCIALYHRAKRCCSCTR